MMIMMMTASLSSTIIFLFSVILLTSTTAVVSAAAAAGTNDFIRSTIIKIQQTEVDILLQDVFDCVPGDCYQTEALQATSNNLRDLDPSILDIRNYYTLACIYFATNGKENPRTVTLLENNDDDATNNNITSDSLPNWYTDDWLPTGSSRLSSNDYCNWFGISCEFGGTNRITDIELYNNDLYGEWPNEVVLLRESLERIDLYDNEFLWSWEPKWLSKMTALKYLYFGKTAFDALGIPKYLGGCTNLVELDISSSYWSDGPIPDEAFAGLTQLYYLRMSGNTYFGREEDGQIFPPSFASLPLQYFYMTDAKVNIPLTLDFLLWWKSTLRETWLDNTHLSVESISPAIGQMSSLEELSLVRNNLGGTLPTELAQLTKLQYIWLLGNNFTNTIPEEWNNFVNQGELQGLFIEGNDGLTGTIPETLCTLSTTVEFGELGADCDLCSSSIDGCCSCCGEDCFYLMAPTPAPTPMVATDESTDASGGTGAIPPMGFCFSGNNYVDVEHVGKVRMSDIKIGDKVLVSSGGEEGVEGNKRKFHYEPIYMFGHKDSTIATNYLRITTDSAKRILELSKDHMVAIYDKEGHNTRYRTTRYVPASMIQIGDELITTSSSAKEETGAILDVAVVTRIETNIIRKGAYAPFTKSGTIVVNDIVASNYIAYSDNSEYVIPGIISYQWMAHTFMSIVYQYLQIRSSKISLSLNNNSNFEEEEGISKWVEIPHKVISKIISLQQQRNHNISSIAASVLLLVMIAIVGIVSFLLEQPPQMNIITIGSLSLLAILFFMKKKKNKGE